MMGRLLQRLIRRLRRRNNAMHLTGIYMSRGFIRPHHTVYEYVPISPRTVRRLALAIGDRLEFDIAPRTGVAKRVVCYKRFVDAPASREW